MARFAATTGAGQRGAQALDGPALSNYHRAHAGPVLAVHAVRCLRVSPTPKPPNKPSHPHCPVGCRLCHACCGRAQRQPHIGTDFFNHKGTSMTSKKHLFVLAALCAALLTACGGKKSTSTTADDDEFKFEEYLGTWTGDTTVCRSGFPYRDGKYYFRLSTLVLEEKAARATHIAYTDKDCTYKAGKVVDDYKATWYTGSVSGKKNVARLKLEFKDYTEGPDGGSGITSGGTTPDGTALSKSGKLLLDVDGTRLYGPASGASLDSDGYPNALNTTSFATKQ